MADDWKSPKPYETILTALASILATLQKLKKKKPSEQNAYVTHEELKLVIDNVGAIIQLMREMIELHSEHNSILKELQETIRGYGTIVGGHTESIGLLQALAKKEWSQKLEKLKKKHKK